jgi:hypothetical protein
MNAFEEEKQGDWFILFYTFLPEHIGFTNEVLIAAEAHLRIHNLSCLKTQEYSQLLALMANFTTLQKEYSSLKSIVTAKNAKTPPPTTKNPPKWK